MRGRPHGASPGVGRRPVLAAGPRRSRVALPALPDVLELLAARGRHPEVQRIAVEPRRFASRDALEGFIRRQLWIDPTGKKEPRFQKALDTLTVDDGDGWTIAGRGPSDVGVVTWTPR